MQKWWNWVVAIALVCLLFIAIPLTYGESKEKLMKPMFDEYIHKYNKTYKNNPAEYETRLRNFITNVEEIDRLNAETRGPEEHKARYGLTKLSDMSKSEYRDLHLSDEKMIKSPHGYGKSWDQNTHHHRHEYNINSDDRDRNINININIISRTKRAALPLSFDWRTKGVIGGVRNQGLCGACWAFSTVGTAEAMAAISTGKLTPLSVQEVIDCAGLGNSGCAGGDICLLLDWLLLTNTALQKDNEYPLRLTDGACRLGKNVTGVTIKTFTCDDFVGSEDQILSAIATHGPVAVAVNALTWQNYLGGVIQFHCSQIVFDKLCQKPTGVMRIIYVKMGYSGGLLPIPIGEHGGDYSKLLSGAPEDLNHAVELVGYDLTAEVPYYIAKNSWGTDFGNSGYIHLAVGGNICGLANEVATVDVTSSLV